MNTLAAPSTRYLCLLVAMIAFAPTGFTQEEDELDKAEREASKIGDVERFALLKPEMTKEEAKKAWFGKKMVSQGCGSSIKDGKVVPSYGNVYTFDLTDGRKSTMIFTFVEYELARIYGPGFKYELKGDKYVRTKRDLTRTEKPIELPD